MSCWCMNTSFNWNKRQQNQQKKNPPAEWKYKMLISVCFGTTVCSWQVEPQWKYTAWFVTPSCAHFQGFPSTTPPLNTHPVTQLCVLLLCRDTVTWTCHSQPSVQPCMKDRPCFLKKRKLTWACETSHKAEKRPFVIHWALCGFSSRLECFLQKKTENQVPSGGPFVFFWAIMKRGKAQTHTVMKPISWFRESSHLLDFSCSVSSSLVKTQEELTSSRLMRKTGPKCVYCRKHFLNSDW